MDLVTTILFIAGFLLLIVGADSLVRGASRLAEAAGISAFVVGLTVVAYGTSAPELAVTVQSIYAEPPQPDLAVGNVVGSNISNVLLVLGIAAVVAPLIVSRNVVRAGAPFMIGVSVLMWLLSLDGSIGRLDGAILFSGSVCYTVITVARSRRGSRAARAELASQGHPGRKPLEIIFDLVLVAVGLAMLTVGSRWFVNGAVRLAEYYGVSELIIGLTIVAVGTSLPEIATSVVAVYRGQRDLAVGNVIGSNVFNILLVLGACGILAPDGVAVSDVAIHFDIPVMVAVAIACLPVFLFDSMIARWEGVVFLLYYAAYVTYLCLSATQHSALQPFSAAIVLFAAPLTVLTFLIYWYRVYIGKRASQS